MAAATEGCALLCIALLLFSPDGMLTATYKSRISLSPPWNRILEGDNVTLTCHGDNSSKDSPTKWIHNGTVMSEVKTSSLDILNASFKDSGKYQCQRQNLYRSALVYLDVCRDWLILQASAPVVMEDESISLRCHGWRNWTVYKVIYYKDDEAFKFCYDNDVSTPFINAIVTNSGAYYCTGKFDYGCFLGQQKETYSSEPLTIAVMKDYMMKYNWIQLIIPMLVVILFSMDTWLFVSTEQQFRSLLKIMEARKYEKLSKPLPKPDP